MSVSPAISLNRTIPRVNLRFEREPLRYAVTIAVLMACFLTLVPILREQSRFVFLIVFVPLVIWTSFTDTGKAIYLYIAWCWMDGTIRGIFDNDVIAVLARDIVLIIVLIGWASIRMPNRTRDPIRLPPASALIGLFVINCLLQMANPDSPGFLQSLGGLKEILTPIPLIFISYDVFRRREQCIGLLVFLTLATAIMGAVFVVQYWMGRDWTWAHFPGSQLVIDQLGHATGRGFKLSDMAEFRAPGTTTIGGMPAYYAAIITPMTFALSMLTKNSGISLQARVCFVAMLFMFVVIIFLSSVRSSLVISISSTVVCTLLVGGRLRTRALMILAVFGFIAYGALTFTTNVTEGGVTDRFESMISDPIDTLHSDRKTMFDEIGDVVTRSPLGVGLGRTGAVNGHYKTDTMELGFSVFSESYIDAMIFETGVPGAILIVAIACTYLFLGFRIAMRKRNEDRLIVAAILAQLIIIFALFPFANVLAGPPGSVLFWMMFGVLHGVYGKGSSRAVVVGQVPTPVRASFT